MELDIICDDPRWQAFEPAIVLGVEAVAERFELADIEVSVLGCDDAHIATLNEAFRGKPAPTNVLSWPAQELRCGQGAVPRTPVADPDGTLPLGDIALAWETCQREAEAAQISPAQHVTHLTVHAMLHLLGYDHESDADAHLMEGLEVAILRSLGLPDPYAD